MGFKRFTNVRSFAPYFAAFAVVCVVTCAFFVAQQMIQSNPVQPSIQQPIQAVDTVNQQTWLRLDHAKTDFSRGDDAEMGAQMAFNDCPLALPEQTEELNYRQLANTEVWRGTSTLHCQEYARELLMPLRDTGLNLVYAGYLDMLGNAWGCTLAASDGSSYLATVRSRSGKAGQWLTTVSIVHILAPQEGSYADF